MKIALTSPNGKTISEHAGKCPGYLIYELDGINIVSKVHVKLSKEQVFRNFSGPLSKQLDHPLKGIQIFITKGLGDGLYQRLSLDGIKVYKVEETDPEGAVASILETTV